MKITTATDIKEVRELAKQFGIKWVGVTKEALVAQVNQKIDEVMSMSEVAASKVENVETPVVEGAQVEATDATQGQKISKHFNHPLCQELVGLLAQVDVTTATVTRGTKNPVTSPLVTEKEQALLTAFQETGYNIKKTSEVLGFSHTNVWQRLYGVDKADKPAKGIIGKLREYVANQQTVNEAV